MRAARGLLVAGTRSGCGKTTVALGIMAALARLGLRVQAFKTGPDFIDPGRHQAVTGRISHNLDDWMLSPRTVAGIFARGAANADIAVVEGAMGLFDGFSGTDEAGSAASLAKRLGLPVLLVVDARSMGRSAAALASGFAAFDPELRLAGVVCNNVAGPSHREILEAAMLAASPVPLLGCLPRREELGLPSRHLGLVTAEDSPASPEQIAALADWAEAHMDLRALLDVMSEIDAPPLPGTEPLQTRLRLGVARDAAFCFYYEENLRHLRLAGLETVSFSPLADGRLPRNLAGLYLGGGYPELRAEALAANAAMRAEIKAFAASGRPIYAECGGFMYLMASLTDQDGRLWPMAGAFPLRSLMGERRAALGYREVRFREPTPLGPAGTVARGHEFHYSRIDPDSLAGVRAAYELTGRGGRLDAPEGFLRGNVLGSYVHLHFGSNPALAENLAAACARAGGLGS